MEQRHDELLDAELTDWHEGDVSCSPHRHLVLLELNLSQDDALERAIEKADTEIDKQKKAIDDKRWKYVADHMRLLKVSCHITMEHIYTPWRIAKAR